MDDDLSFRNLLSELSENLSQVEWKSIASQYAISLSMQQKFTRAMDLFEWMIERGLLSQKTVEKLEKILGNMGREYLADTIREFSSKNNLAWEENLKWENLETPTIISKESERYPTHGFVFTTLPVDLVKQNIQKIGLFDVVTDQNLEGFVVQIWKWPGFYMGIVFIQEIQCFVKARDYIRTFNPQVEIYCGIANSVDSKFPDVISPNQISDGKDFVSCRLQSMEQILSTLLAKETWWRLYGAVSSIKVQAEDTLYCVRQDSVIEKGTKFVHLNGDTFDFVQHLKDNTHALYMGTVWGIQKDDTKRDSAIENALVTVMALLHTVPLDTSNITTAIRFTESKKEIEDKRKEIAKDAKIFCRTRGASILKFLRYVSESTLEFETDRAFLWELKSTLLREEVVRFGGLKILDAQEVGVDSIESSQSESVNDRKKEKHVLEQDLARLRQERNEQDAVISSQQQDLVSLRETNQLLSSLNLEETERFSQKIARLKEKYHAVKTELNFKVGMVDGLQSAVNQMQELNQGLLTSLEDEKTHIQKRSTNNKEKKERILQLENNVKELEAKVDKLKRKIRKERKKPNHSNTIDLSGLSQRGQSEGIRSPPRASRVSEEKSSKTNSVNSSPTSPREDYSISTIKTLIVSNASADFVLRTSVSTAWSIGEIVNKLQKKFPGNSDSFVLFAPADNQKKTWIPLEKDKTLASYLPSIKGTEGNKKNKYLTKVFPKAQEDTKSQEKIRYLMQLQLAYYRCSVLDAIHSGDVNRIQNLLHKEEILALETKGDTPMNEAITTNNFGIIESLLNFYKAKGLQLTAKDKSGWTALHCAVCAITKNEKDEEILKRIIEFPGVLVDAVNADNNTPLHYFAQKFLSPNCQEIGKILILKAPSTVNAKNSNGETPLHKAIFNPSVRLLMVSLLVNHGADPNIPNMKGETALHYAVRLGRKDIVKQLLHVGASITVKELRENKTPYDLAVENDAEIAQILKDAKGGFNHQFLLSFPELREWLSTLRVEEHYMSFLRGDVTLKKLAELQDPELESLFVNMKVDALGVRIRMIKACADLRVKFLKKSMNQRMKAAKRRPSWEKTPEQKQIIEQLKKGIVTSAESFWMISNQKEFEFTKELGSGTSGKVYKGIYRNDKVAIKVLKAVNEEALEAFKKEFTIMSIVQSKNIVHFFGASLEPKVCMVMEYCSKGSLYNVMKSDKNQIDWARGLSFAIDMANGMNTLHTWDPPAFHRDIKTPNLLVNEDWVVKVCDMGLARFNTPDQLATMNRLCGTYAYLAPEIFFGNTFTAKSDVFSMGIILWEIASRIVKGKYQIPYEEFTDLRQDFLVAIKVAEQGRRPTIPESCPLPWRNLIQRCLAHNPDERPTTALMLKDLSSMQEEYKLKPENWSH